MLTILLIAVIGGLAIFFIVLGLTRRGKDARIGERLERYAAREVEQMEELKRTGRGETGIAGRLNRAITARSSSSDIATKLARADLKIKVSEYVLLNTASVLIFFVLGFAVFGKSLLLGLAAGVAGFFVPRIYLSMRQKRRVKAFNDQLSDAINLVVNSLRSGYSLLQSMEVVSKELPPPVSVEFGRVVQEVGLGLSLEQALANMLRRIRSDDLDMMISVVNIQHEVGGNLAEVLDTISHTIRERVRIQGEISVLTAQQMLTAYLIGFLPLFLGLALYALNRGYISLLFSELCGWIMLAVAAIIVTVGFIAIRKIVAIEV